MKIQVLVSTMNDHSFELYKKMNSKTNMIISNQDDFEKTEVKTIASNEVQLITKNERGLANSRNTLLKNASADYCLIADDDIVYHDNYVDKISQAISKYPEADVLIFNMDNMGKRYEIKEDFQVSEFTYQRFGSVRILFKLSSIQTKKIKFNPTFGAGSFYTSGEDTLFLKACLNNNLKIVAVSETIGLLSDDRPSSWFNGYDDKFYFDKGALFKALYPKLSMFWITQFAMRKFKLKENGSFSSVLKLMRTGAKAYKSGQYMDKNGLIKEIGE